MTKESPTPSERAEFEAWATRDGGFDHWLVEQWKEGTLLEGSDVEEIISAAWDAWQASAARASVSEDAARPLDTEYAWLIDGEWQGSSTDARECLRYIEQYRADGEVEVTRIVTYPCSEDELHAIASRPTP